MTEHRDNPPGAHRPGDFILDHYIPHATPDQREEARAQLYDFVAWQMRILIQQVRRELSDSHEQPERDTLDSASQPP